MENGSPQATAGASAPGTSPPPPPNPNADTRAGSTDSETGDEKKSDEPVICPSEDWDINSISALAALHMLIEALTALSTITGDIPPTPPVTRPSTPKAEQPQLLPSTPPTDHLHQHLTLSRRFFSKTPPPFTLAAYLLRFHSYCPHSPAVYLAASTYIHRLCVLDLLVPATARTIHRLALASISVASKVLEDHKWPHARFAAVGGVSARQLMGLEVTVCFLLGFELGVGVERLRGGMFGLQQAGRHGFGGKRGFALKLPAGKREREKVLVREAAAAMVG